MIKLTRHISKGKLKTFLQILLFIPNILLAQNSTNDKSLYLGFEKDQPGVGSGLTRTFTLNSDYKGNIVQDSGSGKSRSFRIIGKEANISTLYQ